MAVVGGELEEMTILGQKFRENGSLAHNIKVTIDSTLATTTWTGPAADRFRDAWNSFSPSLDQLRQALEDAAAEVEMRRNHLQEVTS